MNNKNAILGHPPSLFVLFFTEMWERFSYYGMRALLVLFLTSALIDGGWEWAREDALKLYGLYTGLVYITPVIGGFIADKFMGYRNAIVLGALIMTLGHASMAVETPFFFYLGLSGLIIGNGLFKPNISSMVGGLYKDREEDKDGAYTIFYMGINAGAFLGIMLCGYIGEKVGWSYGFGLAGIFMFLGMMQFWFTQGIFGKLGEKPDNNNNFIDNIDEEQAADDAIPSNVKVDRMIVIGVLSLFTVFFWWAFEQAGGSMTVFANDYTDRLLTGDSADIFKWVNTALTIVPLMIITYVLFMLFQRTFEKYSLANLFLGGSFVIIWGLVIWMLNRELAAESTEVPASWFGILNSFFIISLAPLFSKIWESKLNPSGPVKFGIGLILVGIGFGALAYGAAGIPQGAETASVSMLWLIAAYCLHTMGELCVSPVGLSYVSKLSPKKLVGAMFGIWFVSNFVANLLGGFTGAYIDYISETYSMSIFFMIFTIIPIGAGLLMFILTPMLKKMMHGIE